MRFPIYVFFLMSGVFYLTGNPFSDETGKPGIQGKVASLKYGRRINAPLIVDKAAETSAKPADAKMTATTKPYTVAASGKSTSVSDAKMQLSAVAVVQEPARVTSPATASTPESKPSSNGKEKRFKDLARKSLDWTVFGNKRKNAALKVPARTRSQDEIDAEGIKDEPRKVRQYNPRKLASKNGKYKRAKLKRQRLKAKRTARTANKARVARKNKRVARLKRRNKGVYRIARKTKKKSVKKKNTVANKPRRKKFGFTQVGAQSRLSW